MIGTGITACLSHTAKDGEEPLTWPGAQASALEDARIKGSEYDETSPVHHLQSRTCCQPVKLHQGLQTASEPGARRKVIFKPVVQEWRDTELVEVWHASLSALAAIYYCRWPLCTSCPHMKTKPKNHCDPSPLSRITSILKNKTKQTNQPPKCNLHKSKASILSTQFQVSWQLICKLQSIFLTPKWDFHFLFFCINSLPPSSTIDGLAASTNSFVYFRVSLYQMYSMYLTIFLIVVKYV